jgi:hypothetical protein
MGSAAVVVNSTAVASFITGALDLSAGKAVTGGPKPADGNVEALG